MPILEEATSLLKQEIVKGNKSYNYKLLSRTLDIHVNDAKKLLYSFYLKNTDLVEPTYAITGQFRGSSGLTVKLTSDLDDREKFDRVDSIQVYSLTPQNISVASVISTINEKLKQIDVNEDKIRKWGVIKGPELTHEERPPQPVVIPTRQPVASRQTAAQAPTIKPEQSSKKNDDAFPDMGLRSAQILAKNRKAEPTKKSNQPSFGRSATREPVKPKHDTSRRSKTDPIVKSNTDVTESVELDDEEFIKKEEALKQERLKKQKELESMFDDDDEDGDVGDDKNEDQEVESGNKQQDKIDDSNIPQNDHLDEIAKPDDDLDKPKLEGIETIFDSSFSQSQPQSEIKPQSATNSQDSKAKEAITSSYYDDEGYLVTKVEKTAPKAKAKTSARSSSSKNDKATQSPPAKKAKTGGPKQQTSLLSFFGKK